MSKIQASQENPIDRVIVQICEGVSDSFYVTNHSPNILTTYSLIAGIVAIFGVLNGSSVQFTAGVVVSYFFDCLDGYFARKYGMVSEFGDYYDHVKDAVVVFLLKTALFYRYPNQTKWAIPLFSVMMYLMAMHIGCQQHFVEGKGSETIDMYMTLCPKRDLIYLTRFFGSGTYYLFLIMYFNYTMYMNK